MPLYTSASLSLQYHSEDDQFVALSPALWNAIVPTDQQQNGKLELNALFQRSPFLYILYICTNLYIYI